MVGRRPEETWKSSFEEGKGYKACSFAIWSPLVVITELVGQLGVIQLVLDTLSLPSTVR